MRCCVSLFLLALGAMSSGCIQKVDYTGAVKPDSTIFRLIIYNNIGDANTETIILDDPTPEALLEQFDSLDWENPLHMNELMVQRGITNAPDYISLSVSGVFGSTDNDKLMDAHWSELPAGQEVWKHCYFKPFNSKEEAKKLLLSFLKQDDEYRTLVAWEE